MAFPFRRAQCAVLLSLVLPPAFSQQMPAPPAARTWIPADFARFAPRNALNMLQQVPGFAIRAATQERGLGQASGNVLVDGQRLAGKSTDVLGQLERIPAGNVVRIELRDATSFDIPGLTGQIANVVTRTAAVSGQWEWKPEWRAQYADPLYTRGNVSAAGTTGRVDWTLGLANNASHGAAGGPTTLTNPDGSLREARQEEMSSETEVPTLSAQFAFHRANGHSAHLNARYQRVEQRYLERGVRVGPGLPDRFRTVRANKDGDNHELGGDIEFGVGPGTLALIGVVRGESYAKVDTVATEALDGSADPVVDRYTRDSTSRERIARGEYRWNGFGGELQASLEYAYNRLDSTATINALPMAGADATVEEDRYEAMGSYGRALSPSLQMQVNLGGEYSRLAQLGAGGDVRAFRRPKGSASLGWQPSEAFDLNLALERRVGQLDFQDFLASVELDVGQANAGNPDLVPPQTWELSLETHRALGEWGDTTLRVYAQRIDDLVDIVPIGESGESPGNLERATVRGFEWKGTLRFGEWGWRGAKLDATWQMEDSDVCDPLTGTRRPISNHLASLAKLDFRHDVPDTPWAWGAYASATWRELDYRMREVGRQWEGPVFGGVFVEHKALAGLKVRFNASNLPDGMSLWDRTVFVGRRGGPVAWHEMRNRRIGPIFTLTVGGTF